MQFYAYKGSAELGKEPCGGDGKLIIRDLKTVRGAHKRCRTYLGSEYRLYTFTSFYDNKTFKECK